MACRVNRPRLPRLPGIVSMVLAQLITGGPLLQAQPPAPTEAGTPIGTLPGDWARRGDTQVTALPDSRFAFGVQYRIVYDRANLPGPAGTAPDDPERYDFFRQRVRLNFEAAPTDAVGAFVQAEFRGGWGGSSPAASDPRAAQPTVNPYNLISSRGLRYSYLYWKPNASHQLQAGILPVSDEFGDTLFSADWDWMTGGVAWLAGSQRSRWRIAALNLIEGVGSPDPGTVGHDGLLLVADFAHRPQPRPGAWTLDWGAHAYALVVEERLPLGGTRSFWIGPTVAIRKDDFALRLFGIANTGELGIGQLAADGTVAAGFSAPEAQAYAGFAFRAEAEKTIRRVPLKAQVVYTSGDREGRVDNRFVTPMGLFRTAGYWGYTHIFTANPPSDVNDFGIDIGNQGAGLWTLQLTGRLPLTDRVGLDLSGGYFRADEPRNGRRHMGREVAASVRAHLSGPLYLDAGAALARLGRFFGRDPHTMYEVFSRLQLQY